MEKNIDVSIIMGSDSDLPIMSESAKFLETIGISYEIKILSVHRCPDEAIDYAKRLKKRNVKVINNEDGSTTNDYSYELYIVNEDNTSLVASFVGFY